MGIKTNELQLLTTAQATDAILVDAASAGTGRMTFANASKVIDKELVKSTADVGKALAAKQAKLTGTRGQVVGYNAAGAAVPVRGWSNSNMLINSDFRLLVNQLGQNTYEAVTKNEKTVDMWRIYQNTKLVVSDGKITISAIAAGALQIYQYLPYAYEDLLNQQICVSLLDGAGNLYTASGTVTGAEPAGMTTYAYVTIPGVGRLNFSYSPAIKKYYVHVYNSDAAAGTSLDIAAMKLEQGQTQTLAHKEGDAWVLNDPPDYARELSRCRRYFYKNTDGGTEFIRAGRVGPNVIYFDLPVPARMWKTPAIVNPDSLSVYRTAQPGVKGGSDIDTEVSGFTFAASLLGGATLRIQASKTEHELTDATLFATGTLFDANL